MKTFKTIIVAIAALLVFQSVNAQSDKHERAIGIKTQNIKVSGTCSMDKLRIETAANSVDGVKSAFWDEYPQILTLKYSVFKKEVTDNVQRKIALFGNDTEKYKANNAVYQSLPDCCHYRNI
jgi:periplasmic mercuric ion binding protein